MGNFTATVEAWAAESAERMSAIAKASIQDVIDDASKAKGKGGNMPIDTGFLRASGQISFNGMPTGPTRPEPAQANYSDGSAVGNVTVQLAKFKLGQTVFFGWTANYAVIQEAKNAFLRLAVQNWKYIVASNVTKAKQRSVKK